MRYLPFFFIKNPANLGSGIKHCQMYIKHLVGLIFLWQLGPLNLCAKNFRHFFFGYVKFLALTVLFHVGGFSTPISQLPQACWELTRPSSVGATSRSRPGGRSYRIHVIRNRQVPKTLDIFLDINCTLIYNLGMPKIYSQCL